MVIHRRPHCSATMAVVPDPHVGSSTRSPGSVVIRMHRSIDRWLRSEPHRPSGRRGFGCRRCPSMQLDSGNAGKSSMITDVSQEYSWLPATLFAAIRRRIPSWFVFHRVCMVGVKGRPSISTVNHDAAPSPLARPALSLVRLSSRKCQPENALSSRRLRLSCACRLVVLPGRTCQLRGLPAALGDVKAAIFYCPQSYVHTRECSRLCLK